MAFSARLDLVNVNDARRLYRELEDTRYALLSVDPPRCEVVLARIARGQPYATSAQARTEAGRRWPGMKLGRALHTGRFWVWEVRKDDARQHGLTEAA